MVERNKDFSSISQKKRFRKKSSVGVSYEKLQWLPLAMHDIKIDAGGLWKLW
jgi:hypothetical protein